jgi:predicted transposase YdaD
MVLTTADEVSAPAIARSLLARSRSVSSEASREEGQPQAVGRAIMEMITTIMVYKFTNLNRREVEAMLGIALQETRVYQEAKEEGREEGRQQEGRSLILRLLTRRVGTLPDNLAAQITALPLEQLEALAEALLDFQAIADLETWLES